MVFFTFFFGFVLLIICGLFAFILGQDKLKLGTTRDTKNQLQLYSQATFFQLSILRLFFSFIFIARGRLTKYFTYLCQLGKLTEFKFWGKRYLLVNDFKVAKEALRNPIVCGRPAVPFYDFYAQGAKGFFAEEGWREHKKFFHLNLKAFSADTVENEAFMRNEIDKFCDGWLQKVGEPFSPIEEFNLPVLKFIWLLLTGEKATAETSKMILSLFEDFQSCLTPFNLIVAGTNVEAKTVERIHNYIPIFSTFKSAVKNVKKLRSYLQEVVDRKKETFVLKEYFTDIVDAYLNVKFQPLKKQTTFSANIEDKLLVSIMFELVFAGVDTTSSTLTWALLHLIRNSDIQEKIWNEVNCVVGRDRNPCLNDKLSCPYTQAFVNEVLRCSPVSPLGLPHSTYNETTIGGHHVQKDTQVYFNIYGIHHDPVIWGDPHNFRPERFLSTDGKSFVRNEAMCIFSSGARKCLGEQVARDSMFLFVSSICKRFRLQSDPGLKGRPKLYDNNSLVLLPQNFNIVVLNRSHD